MFYNDEKIKCAIMRELAKNYELDFIDFFWETLYEKFDNFTVCDVACAFGGLIDDGEIESDDNKTYCLAPHLRSWFEDGDEEFKDAAFADEYVGDLAKTAWGELEEDE